MIDAILSVRRNGGFIPKATSHANRNSKYTDEFKKEALKLQKELGSRNKAAKELGIAASLLSTFNKQRDEGQF